MFVMMQLSVFMFTGLASTLKDTFYPNLVGDKIGSIWITLRQSVRQSVSWRMPQLIFQTLKNNYLSQDVIFEIGITRATAHTGCYCPKNDQKHALIFTLSTIFKAAHVDKKCALHVWEGPGDIGENVTLGKCKNWGKYFGHFVMW